MTELSYKEKVMRAFSKATNSYDTFAGLQRDVALKTVGLIDATPKRILDIGCGTGNVTKELLKLYPDADVFAVDLSHSMVGATRQATKECDGFITADLEALPFADKTFDTIVSSLTYQWTKDLSLAMAEAFRVLSPDGTFVFSTLGPNTFKELNKIRADILKTTGRNGLSPSIEFASSDILSKAIKAAGFEIEALRAQEVRREYKDLFALLKTLKGIGALNPTTPEDKTLAQGTLLREISDNYSERFSTEDGQQVYATYDLLYFSLKKK
ncbi:MAG: methyltransferase domain-containing protein [Deltaproteobacteria bacterium]|nr:methyltransferase domain-containing protein [Deltaproteobacteria bacterium]